MLTREQVYEVIKGGRKSRCELIDSRDYGRLSGFFPADQWETFGFKLKEGKTAPEVKPWTREAILEQLRDDVAFGIEKAVNQRGISSSLMYEVVKMWMWILEDDLQNHSDYHSYGLPFFREVEAKYLSSPAVTA